MTDEPSYSLIDPDHQCRLHDVGDQDHIAVVAIGHDGEQALVLARVDAIGDTTVGYSRDSAVVAPHEQLGGLPAGWRDRIALAPLRCGRPTRTGGRCRAYVSAPNAACGRHREIDSPTKKEGLRP